MTPLFVEAAGTSRLPVYLLAPIRLRLYADDAAVFRGCSRSDAEWRHRRGVEGVATCLLPRRTVHADLRPFVCLVFFFFSCIVVQ